LSAEEAEAKACLGAVKEIPKPDNLLVVLESDNAAIVDAIKKNRSCRLSGIPTKRSRLWKAGWVVLKVSNQAAHALAKIAKSSVFYSLWMGHVPAKVVSIVEDDIVNCVIPVE
jgi:hypothetical protein